MSVSRKTLESGNVLRTLIQIYKNNESENTLYGVLRCLRDSTLLVPCKAQISDRDVKQFLNSDVGSKIKIADEIKMTPDIIRSGDTYFLPAFTSIECMGEDYGSRFSTIEKDIFDIMSMADSYQKTIGIIIDPFTNPFVVYKEIFDYIASIPSELESASQNKFTFFWHEYEENGYLSNWWCSDNWFVIDDFRYSCVEQYIMAKEAKMFHDSYCYTQILKASSPKECKELGRKVSRFDERKWNAVRYNILLEGLRAKFGQNEKLKNYLLSTGDTIIAEASPYDSIFGIGITADKAKNISPDKWRGENLLGKALMQVRNELKAK